jgi:hypothetical protein
MVKVLLILMVIFVLMEDSTSIRKTEEEKREDEEVQRAVNATLAEEEKRKQEEEDERQKKNRTQDEKKPDQGKVKKEKKEDRLEKQDRQDEACLPVNVSCPVEVTCVPCDECPECPPVECGPCPGVKPCRPCRPCGPDPVVNSTVETTPGCQCPEGSGLSLLAAMAVGACAGLMVTGVATAFGLILRYVPPTVSGFLILATIIILWYLCSHYPDTARELGGRAVVLIREAALTLSHRAMAVIRRHQDQVDALSEFNLFF